MYYYVYILISRKDHQFYIGYTKNLKRRILEHGRENVKSTRYRAPMILLCYEAYCDKKEALLREKFLKSSDGKRDLRKRLTISLKDYKKN